MKRFFAILAALTAISGGCSGNVRITVGDQVAPAGGEAVVVARIERSEVWRYYLPVKYSLLQFRLGEGRDRGAYTDLSGYTAVSVPVPAKPGIYPLATHYCDSWTGDEASVQASVYVFDPARPVVAVDLDCIDFSGSQAGQSQRRALATAGEKADIIYFTRRDIDEHAKIHELMKSSKFPDGPILMWERKRFHIVFEDKHFAGETISIPTRVQFETRMESQIPELKKILPKLAVGICDSTAAAKTFMAAGLKCVVIGQAEASGYVQRFASWSDLASKGL
ncbi:MAG: hypothetical protein HZA50_12620 [Planctomycetes bacterium]|nr:hypothetical protein [Planctomycetota bacterium]